MFSQTIFSARGTQGKKQEWDSDVLPRARSASAFGQIIVKCKTKSVLHNIWELYTHTLPTISHLERIE